MVEYHASVSRHGTVGIEVGQDVRLIRLESFDVSDVVVAHRKAWARVVGEIEAQRLVLEQPRCYRVDLIGAEGRERVCLGCFHNNINGRRASIA